MRKTTEASVQILRAMSPVTTVRVSVHSCLASTLNRVETCESVTHLYVAMQLHDARAYDISYVYRSLQLNTQREREEKALTQQFYLPLYCLPASIHLTCFIIHLLLG